MANERKEWEELLESTNKKLLERGFELRIHEDEEGYFSLDIFNFDLGQPETYAENYFENELCNLIYEAVAYVNGKTSESAPKKIIYIVHSDADILEEKEFSELTDEEIKEMYDAGSDYVDRYDSIEELAANWNADEIFSSLFSYMRIIEE